MSERAWIHLWYVSKPVPPCHGTHPYPKDPAVLKILRDSELLRRSVFNTPPPYLLRRETHLWGEKCLQTQENRVSEGGGGCRHSKSLCGSKFTTHSKFTAGVVFLVRQGSFWAWLFSGESDRPLTPMLLKSIAMHLPFVSPYFCKNMPSSWQKVVYTPPICTRYGSHLYRDTFAEVFGSGVVGTLLISGKKLKGNN